MANVLTSVAPVLYSDGRIVPREPVGLLNLTDNRWNDVGVALNDTVKIPISPVQTVGSISTGATFPSGTDRTFTSKTFTLGQTAETSWNLDAEQERSLANGGSNAIQALKQTINQGCRAIVNAIESYVCTVADKNASRAYGTAGTAPFGSTVADAANVRQILVDNGAPMVDLGLAINTTAGVNLRSLSNLFKVNEAGTGDMLRRGILGDLFGMQVAESAGIASHTKGTGASYTTDTAGYAVGSTAITLITGSGTILAGDVVTFAGDSNKYVVDTALTGGVVTLQEPGLKVAIATSATAITVGNNHASNIALFRNSLITVVRPALQPDGAICEQMVLSDPMTGLSFLLLRVPQNGRTSWFLRCVYDAFAPNPYGIAKLLG